MITVVSGLPRSGTSLMMQMIVAGGIPALTDGLRSADENNLKGYLEWEAAKALPQSPAAITAAEGKVVKVISALLKSLPGPHEYRVVFMRRPLEEVITSQNRMLERLGREVAPVPQASVVTAFTNHLKEIKKWLSEQPNMSVHYVDYPSVVQQPGVESARIAEFLGQPLKIDAMKAQVEQSLYRERSGAVAAKS
jgi:Sulfotransferase domain